MERFKAPDQQDEPPIPIGIINYGVLEVCDKRGGINEETQVLKCKNVVQLVLEYDINSSLYPTGIKDEEMVDVDRQNYGAEPYFMLDNESVLTVTDEVIEDDA